MLFRAERKLGQACSEEEYAKVFDRLNSLPSKVEHLILQLHQEKPQLLTSANCQ
jgi:hypothetical protein